MRKRQKNEKRQIVHGAIRMMHYDNFCHRRLSDLYVVAGAETNLENVAEEGP